MDSQDGQDNKGNYKILLILYIHVNLFQPLLRGFVSFVRLCGYTQYHYGRLMTISLDTTLA